MDQRKKTLLLLAEDFSYQQQMREYFNQFQYITYGAQKLAEAQELFFSNNHEIDIVILVETMNREGIKEMIREIRSYSDVPIMILMSQNSEEHHLEYMEAGADHCMVIPFNRKILKVYVDNFYIRRHRYRENEEIHGKLRIDRVAQKVYIDNEDLRLTPKEYGVLDYFIQNKNIVLTREAILDAIWGYDYQGDIRTVDTLIKQLRKKMTTDCAYIRSVYGVGYRFEGR